MPTLIPVRSLFQAEQQLADERGQSGLTVAAGEALDEDRRWSATLVCRS
jgi:hypothetical protein